MVGTPQRGCGGDERLGEGQRLVGVTVEEVERLLLQGREVRLDLRLGKSLERFEVSR